MVWEVHSMVIVMTTRTVEQGRHKCGQYWQPEAGQQCQHGNFNILTKSVEANSDFVVCELLLTNLQVCFVFEAMYLRIGMVIFTNF